MKKIKRSTLEIVIEDVAIQITDENRDDVSSMWELYNDYLINIDDIVRLCEYYHISYNYIV